MARAEHDEGVMSRAWTDQSLPPGGRWLVTGGAGFIGSHLVVELLRHGQRVTVLDDLSTGAERNIVAARQAVPSAAADLTFVRGSCTDREVVASCLVNADHVLHQAALGSIPRSFADPLPTDAANVHGFLTVLHGALVGKVKSFVYASSSAVYGDSQRLPKVEDEMGLPLSPYAVSKQCNEQYARVLAERHPETRVVGLRYFNVFGPRQNPEGAYAAVVPRWIGEMLAGKPTTVYGDGSQSRDFCYVANVVQANLRAAVAGGRTGEARVFNIAAGARASLLDLHRWLGGLIREARPGLQVPEPRFSERRAGDIPHSHADVSRAMKDLEYLPSHDLLAGLRETVEWFVRSSAQETSP